MLKKSLSENALNSSFYVIVIAFAAFCLLPFWLVIASSITDEITLVREGYRLFPSKLSLDAYKLIFRTNTIFDAYKVTIFITVVGTFLSMIITSAIAYPLSLRKLRYKNYIAFFIFFTMLFSGGLVPMYILIVRYLSLKDSIWVLIIPALIQPWNLFLLRNFFKTIPESLSESATIDGANDMTILFRIILPLSLPGIATISLFYALGYWNEWFRALLFIEDRSLYPLQNIIMSILRNLNFANQIARESGIRDQMVIPAYTTRMATTIVTIGPIIFLYPFIQKYFIKGLTIGAIKG